ncbi:MAG TPA: transglycosylase domain-containing protein [Acidimicrobiales bacterium]|nr:transglycosylase domain-containing protein [Acidimicrobiales bacterium]
MRRSPPVFLGPSAASQRVLDRPPAGRGRGKAAPARTPARAGTAKPKRPQRPSWFWRYRRLWFLLGLVALTGLAGAAWVITQVPLPPEVPQAQTTIIYDAAGAQIAVLHGNENRFPVKLDQVPKVTIDAVVSTEDRNFFTHKGIDPLGIARATWADIRNQGTRQGASTITQQYVKNAYVGGGGRGRTLARKLKEAVIAVKLENKFSKQQILERYLNAVYFGRGAYGIQAAAKAYFGMDVTQLGLRESVYLAGIIRSPSKADVATDPDLATRYRSVAVEAMVRTRAITRAQADEVLAVRLASYVISPSQSQTTVTSDVKGVDYFVEYVRHQLLQKYSLDQVLRGGLRVHTTLDPKLQNLAYDAVYTDTLNRTSDPAGALVSLDPEGRVVAMVGGKDWSKSQVNLAVGTEGGGRGRQGGSAFKPFLLAETVSEGYSVESSFRGPAKIVLPKALGGEDWEVNNYENASFGQINLIDATTFSVNTVYAQLVTTIGADKVVGMAHKLGIRSPLNAVPSVALGTQNVSVLEMAGAYSTFANEGVQVEPRVLKQVSLGDSVVLDDQPKRTRVLERSHADTVNFVLGQVVERGSGVAAQLPDGPAWGKTGTSEDYGDAWFVGFNKKLTTAVWMGYPQGQSQPMVSVHGVAKVNGGSLPAQIWKRFMSRAAPGDDGGYPIPRNFDGTPLGALLRFSEPTVSTTQPTSSSDSVPSSSTVPASPPSTQASQSKPSNDPPVVVSTSPPVQATDPPDPDVSIPDITRPTITRPTR